MRLEERLSRLRGELPTLPEQAQTQAPAVDPGPSLAQRLARLRPQSTGEAGTARRERPPGREAVVPAPAADATGPAAVAAGRLPPQAASLDGMLEGIWAAPGVLLVERRIPLAQTHGSVSLGEGLAALAGLAERALGLGQAGDPSGWCLLDTETSGLAGGTGTWVFACGLGRPQGDALVLRQLLLARLDAEPAFLAALGEAMTGCTLLVTYNGKSFDLPLLATRLQLAARTGGHAAAWPQGSGAGPDLKSVPHLDLLHPIRRAFTPVWPDCRLGSAETRLLGLRRQGDLSGAEAPRAWLDWLRRAETAGLAGVLGHNRLDLLALATLPAPIARALADPAQVGADPLAVAGWHRDRGDTHQARRVLELNRLALSRVGLLELARCRYRDGDWGGVCDLLAPLAECGDADALAALAKLWEHRLGDAARALDLARRLPPGEERERRCRRLEAKLGRGRANT